MNTGLPAFRTLILQTGGAAATLTLNRPDALNAIDVAMAEDLQRAAQWLETRADIRVVTLQGAGNALCAGRRHLDVRRRGLRGARITDGPVHATQRFLVRVARMDKVWLAQVHGIAGAGLSLTLACDLAIAEAGTRFMTAYLKLGATPDAGMTHGLMRTVGPKRALDLLLRHDPFSAEEALSWGLVTRVHRPVSCANRRRPTRAPSPPMRRTASPAPSGCCARRRRLRWKPSSVKKPPAFCKARRGQISPRAWRRSARSGRRVHGA